MATVKQVEFVRGLAASREIPADHDNSQLLLSCLGGTDVKMGEASKLIDWLKTLPRVGTPQPTGGALVHQVPCSSYALVINSDALRFFRVKEWRPEPNKTVRYLRELHGAPGEFNTSKLSKDETQDVLQRILDEGPATVAKRFADHYSVCAKCGAELTDETSRELGLGPVCRQGFGF